MATSPVRITLLSTIAVLGFSACLLAQFTLETEPSDKPDETAVEKPALPGDSFSGFGGEETPAKKKTPLKSETLLVRPSAAPELTPQPDTMDFDGSVKESRRGPIKAPPQRKTAHVVPRTVYVTELRPLSKEEAQELANYEQLIKALREAKDDAARQPIADKIKDILRAKFDRDMAEREKELKVVEERVATLRKQHDKRASMKDEIISLNIKTILFNADGLDFPLGLPPSAFPSPTYTAPDTYSVDPNSINPPFTNRRPMYTPQPGDSPNRLDEFAPPQKRVSSPTSQPTPIAKPSLSPTDLVKPADPVKKAPAKEAPLPTEDNNT